MKRLMSYQENLDFRGTIRTKYLRISYLHKCCAKTCCIFWEDHENDKCLIKMFWIENKF